MWQQFAVGHVNDLCSLARLKRREGGKATKFASVVFEAMEGLAGLFQTEVDFQAVGLVWASLQPRERMSLLLASSSVRHGFLHLLLWFAIHYGI